jgi:hypothetical protein
MRDKDCWLIVHPGHVVSRLNVQCSEYLTIK